MKQHPMAKAYIQAFVKKNGKQWKARFNTYSLDQVFRFGYNEFRFRIQSASNVASYDEQFIPSGARRFDVVMIPDAGNNFRRWLPCDSEAKAEYESFMTAVSNTFAEYE